MNKKVSIIILFILVGVCLSYFTTAFSVLEIAPKGFIYDAPKEISKETAEMALEEAEIEIAEMKEYNFITLFPNDALIEAKKAHTNEEYEQVLKLTQLISYVKKEKFEFYDRVRLLEIKTQAMEEKGMEETEDVHVMMQQAMKHLLSNIIIHLQMKF